MLALVVGNSMDLASGSPESASRSVSGTPVPFERRLDKTVLEKIETLESREGSLDSQTFPVTPKPTSVIQPNPQTTASAATTDDTSRNTEPAPPAPPAQAAPPAPPYNKQVRMSVGNSFYRVVLVRIQLIVNLF